MCGAWDKGCVAARVGPRSAGVYILAGRLVRDWRKTKWEHVLDRGRPTSHATGARSKLLLWCVCVCMTGCAPAGPPPRRASRLHAGATLKRLPTT